MKLEEFIKQTLLDITNGVASAQEASKLFIAPGMIEGTPILSPQVVKIEVAITINKEGEAGISVLSFGEAKGTVSSEHLNKVTVEVPVYFQSKTEKHAEYTNDYPLMAEQKKRSAP